MKRNNMIGIAAILCHTICPAFLAKGDEKTGGGGGKPGAPKDAFSEALADEEAREQYLGDEGEWEQDKSPEFGGASGLLAINPGEATVALLYTGVNMTNLGGDKDVAVHTATLPNGNPVRLPIAASFTRAIDQAKVQVGDKIRIKRFDDAVKKAGKGKGAAMQIYGVKVTVRAAAAQEAA